MNTDRSATGYAWYVLAVLTLIYAISLVDRQILSILSTEVKHDLKLDDANLGFLFGTTFAVFYSVFGIPFGRLADRCNRVILLALALSFWSLMTITSGFATSFVMLAIARIGVGVGEAASSPASFSLISDHFPPHRRATAISIYTSGLYIGVGLSLLAGGFVSSRWVAAFPDAARAPLQLHGWQAAFIAVGLPGLLLALWTLTLREPARRTAPSAVGQASAWRGFFTDLSMILPPLTFFGAARFPGELKVNIAIFAIVALAGALLIFATGDWPQWIAFGIGIYAVSSWLRAVKHHDPAAYESLWGNRQVQTLAIVFGLVGFFSYSVNFWAPAHALRTFYADRQSPGVFITSVRATEEVAIVIGLSSTVAAAIGVTLGGIAADRWRSRHVAGRLYVVALGLIFSVPVTLAMFYTHSLATFFILTPFAMGLGSVWSGAAITSLQDAVPASLRGSAGAVFVLAITMIGLALGPYFVGKVAVLTGDLRLGILTAYLLAPIALFILWRVSRTYQDFESRSVADFGALPRDHTQRSQLP